MGTRQIAVKTAPLRVRAGRGSVAVAAVPGMPESEAEPPAGVVEPVVPVEPEPVAVVEPEPEPESAPTALVIPPKPAHPPVVPPALPAAPLFPEAPGLNWAGPGDHWSRAWAMDTLGGAPQAPAAAPPAGAEEPPTARDVELIRASLAVVEPLADRATAHFYALIFLHHPEVRALFPAAMDVQRDRLFRSLLMAARSADDLPGLTAYLTRLGQGHRKYGTLTGHYAPVGECLVAALAKYCGPKWDAETELAWRRVYGLVATVMSEAAEEAARTSPPWWQAEVVGHQLRTPDVAVLTLRPDQAYPYRAGQYTTLETPWWPRVWRPFSFATAPRPDGLLTLHVKAVQAGWVSNALVHRAGPGDVLRLGPAAGSMVLDHEHGADLVCLGGGTGIAPVTALVEELAEHGRGGRAVDVFYGARRQDGLYELDRLRELASGNPWLTVHPVVSEEQAVGLLAGELPDAVSRYGSWAGRDAYLSGPAAMVRRGARALTRAGVTPGRVFHDLGEGV
ncbi:globin domain-containing protein [Kitasatospora sp. NPDC051853]|uniref:globin domain-containing protein n=1 Tax=Kitasatospora sp. NPDC051853 TaxID=3364058 RepID=UPI0037AC6CB1